MRSKQITQPTDWHAFQQQFRIAKVIHSSKNTFAIKDHRHTEAREGVCDSEEL